MKTVRAFGRYLWNRPIHRLWLDTVLVFVTLCWATPWVTFGEGMLGVAVCVMMSIAYSLSDLALKEPMVVHVEGPVTTQSLNITGHAPKLTMGARQ